MAVRGPAAPGAVGLQADDPGHSSIARRQEIVAYVRLKSLDLDPDLQHADIGELGTLRPG